MRKTNTLLTLLFIAITHASLAQITQLELASGPKKTDFASFSLRPISPGAQFSVATLAFFQKYHEQENHVFDEAGVQTTFYWYMNEGIAIGPGLYYNSVAGFSQRLSVLYLFRSPQVVLTLIPTVAHADKTGQANGELFLQMQWTRPLKNEWKLLLSAQVLTNWEKFSNHTRSFQQLRAGVDKRATQYGLAVDFDQYGNVPVTRTTVGVFIQKIFINN